MNNKNSSTSLKKSIQLLEEEHAFNGQLLIKQFHLTYESLKPVNLLKSTLNEVVTSPYLLDHIIGTSVSLAAGYLSKKIVVAGSDNKSRQLLGSVLQFSITNLITENPKAIKSIRKFIKKHIFHKKKSKRIILSK